MTLAPIQDSAQIVVRDLPINPAVKQGLVRVGGGDDRARDWTVYVVRNIPQLDQGGTFVLPATLQIEAMTGRTRALQETICPTSNAALWARGFCFHICAAEVDVRGIYDTRPNIGGLRYDEVTTAWVCEGRPVEAIDSSYLLCINSAALAAPPYNFVTNPNLFARIPTFAYRMRIGTVGYPASLPNLRVHFFDSTGDDLSQVNPSVNVGNGSNDLLSPAGAAVPPWATYVAVEDTTLVAPTPTNTCGIEWFTRS